MMGAPLDERQTLVVKLALGFVTAMVAACSGDPVHRTDDGGNGRTQNDASAGDPTSRDGSTSHSTDSGDNACARADAKVTRIPPTVWLLLDRGMNNGDVEKKVYEMLREETIGPGGIVPNQQSSVRFGLALAGSLTDASDCPNLVAVEPALNNLQALEAAYPPSQESSVNQLVYYSLKHVLQRMKEVDDPASRRATATVVFVSEIYEAVCVSDLAGLGWPLRRTEDIGPEENDRVVAELANLGVRSYVLGSNEQGEPDDIKRLERMAELGNSGHGPFLVGDGEALGNALREITSSLVSCEVSLQGKVVEGQECSGDVTIDGEAIRCDDANGWRLTGPSSVEFVGDACDSLRSKPSAQIKARFPCEVFTIF